MERQAAAWPLVYLNCVSVSEGERDRKGVSPPTPSRLLNFPAHAAAGGSGSSPRLTVSVNTESKQTYILHKASRHTSH